jgi:WD40 repeat protein
MDIPAHKEAVTCCAWSPDGEHILSSSLDKTLNIFSFTNGGKLLGKLCGHRDGIISSNHSFLN